MFKLALVFMMTFVGQVSFAQSNNSNGHMDVFKNAATLLTQIENSKYVTRPNGVNSSFQQKIHTDLSAALEYYYFEGDLDPEKYSEGQSGEVTSDIVDFNYNENTT